MHVLNKPSYASWASITEPKARYLIRLWLDSLYPTTHPYWSVWPLSLSWLAQYWKLFQRPASEPDWTRPQRLALRVLVRERSPYLDGMRFRPPTGDLDNEWSRYFQGIGLDRAHLKQDLFSTLISALEATHTEESGNLASTLLTLLSELLVEGRSDRELFVRLGTGVLDPKGGREDTHRDRLLGLLEHLKGTTRQSFVVYTKVLQNHRAPSRTIARRAFELEAISDLKPGTWLAQMNDAVFVATRLESTHSLTAFAKHRMTAHAIIQEFMAKLATTGLHLEKESIVHMLPEERGLEWIHSLDVPDVQQHLESVDPAIEPTALSDALEAFVESPQTSIMVLCDAFDRQLGKEWVDPVATAYTRGLRRVLGRRLSNVLVETINRWRNVRSAGAPSWLSAVTLTPIDLSSAAAAIENAGRDTDQLLAERMRRVQRWPRNSSHERNIGPCLVIARGFRNYGVHEGALPTEYGFALGYFAKLLLHSFVACFPKVT